MPDLCSACLCTGRNLHEVEATGFSHIYTQILNEIQVYTLYIDVKICWECKAVMRKFHNFKQQVKNSYVQLMQSLDERNEIKTLAGKEPQLKIHHVSSISYPDIKIEQDILDNEVTDHFNDGTVETYDFIKVDDEMEYDNDEYYEDSVKIERNERASNNLEDKSMRNYDKVSKKDKKKKGEKPVHVKTQKEKKTKDKSKMKKEKEIKVKKKKRKLKEKLSKKDTCDDFQEPYLPLEDGKRVEELEGEREETIDLETKYNAYEETVSEEKTLNITLKPNGVKSKALKDTHSDSALVKPECAECGKVFSSKKTLRYHLNVLHKGNNRYPCPRCGKVYQWKSNLGRHLRSHKARDTGELYCETCDKRFASVATYRQHLSISKQHVSENEFGYTCPDCGKKFVNKTRLRDHVDWEHLQKIKFQCQLCTKPFKCHTSLYVHMKNVHRNKGLKDNLCHVCGKSYQNRAKLRYHIVAMHTTETPYQCEQCDAAFGWYSSLYRHLREVHYKMKLQPHKPKKSKKKLEAPPVIPALVLPPMPPLGPPANLLQSLAHT